VHHPSASKRSFGEQPHQPTRRGPVPKEPATVRELGPGWILPGVADQVAVGLVAMARIS
jgi:hypothetical protein